MDMAIFSQLIHFKHILVLIILNNTNLFRILIINIILMMHANLYFKLIIVIIILNLQLINNLNLLIYS